MSDKFLNKYSIYIHFQSQKQLQFLKMFNKHFNLDKDSEFNYCHLCSFLFAKKSY